MKYLICSLDDTYFLNPGFVTCNTEEEAIKECQNTIQAEKLFLPRLDETLENVEINKTEKSVRYDWSYEDGFLVNEIIAYDETKEYLLIRYHAYNGVDFQILAAGSFKECRDAMYSSVDAEKKDSQNTVNKISNNRCVILENECEHIIYTLIKTSEISLPMDSDKGFSREDCQSILLEHGFSGEYDLLLYVPSVNECVYMQTGDGSQLISEDYENGFDSYIDYKTSVFGKSTENCFEEGDGGLYMYKSTASIAEDFLNHVYDVLLEIYGNTVSDDDFTIMFMKQNLDI